VYPPKNVESINVEPLNHDCLRPRLPMLTSRSCERFRRRVKVNAQVVGSLAELGSR